MNSTMSMSANRPDFVQPIVNQTVPLGRDATFTCVVRNLSGYRIGWVKTDSKAIQAIHDHVITHNPRVWVSTTDQSTWNLHIKNVQEEDRGQYMCQINTDPMKSQTGYLDVVIPPDIINEDTSSDMMVPEGESVRLSCKAKGYPQPHITWRREDNEDIILKDPSGAKERVSTHEGEDLKLTRLSRNEMGAYLCIASNGIPPSVSKRIIINVHFHPVIQVPNQLVGAPFDTNVSLECYVEAYPKPIIYWEKKKDEMLVSNEKYEIQTEIRSQFETKMTLRVKNFHRSDMGTYKCNAKNSVGGVESSIRLYEITGATKYPYIVDEDDMEHVEKDNNHKDENNKGYSFYPKHANNANKANNSTKLSPNRSFILHYRSYGRTLFTSSTIIVTASVTKFLINL
ncbi:hypothetical protein V9T40_010418 [Parthenolecanium corni]|uniref:Ig-like domain-containing protein n=1 Tax=Parthenolecanium corni TaxID=536013 RepID=A0AAN9Y006_9HEMI